MINKLKPELLENRMEQPLDKPVLRQDVRNIEKSEHQVAKEILVQKGILRDPTKPTVLLD